MVDAWPHLYCYNVSVEPWGRVRRGGVQILPDSTNLDLIYSNPDIQNHPNFQSDTRAHCWTISSMGRVQKGGYKGGYKKKGVQKRGVQKKGGTKKRGVQKKGYKKMGVQKKGGKKKGGYKKKGGTKKRGYKKKGGTKKRGYKKWGVQRGGTKKGGYKKVPKSFSRGPTEGTVEIFFMFNNKSIV